MIVKLLKVVKKIVPIAGIMMISLFLGLGIVTAQALNVEDHVKNKVNISGVIKQDGYEDTYNYQVPYIVDKTPAAEAINEEISEYFSDIIEYSLETINAGDTPDTMLVTWKAYAYKDIISIIIETQYYPDEYYIYNYDVKNKKALTTEDIIAMLGVSEKDYLTAVNRGVVNAYDKNHVELPYDEEFLGRYYDESFILRSVELNDIDIFSSQICFNESGPCASVVLYTPAGAGYFYRLVPLDFDWKKSSVKKTVSDDFFDIKLANNEVEIVVNNMEDLYANVREGKNLQGNKFKVEGLYSKYKDIYLGNIGYDYNPYLVLTTEDGLVEFVDLIAGLRSGRFATFAMPGVKDVVSVHYASLDIGDGMKFPTTVVENIDGEIFDLHKAATLAKETLPFDMLLNESIASDYIEHFLASGNSYNEMYIFSFPSASALLMETYVKEMEESFYYDSGSYECLGMTDEGLLYNFNIYGDTEDSIIESTVLMNLNYYDNSVAIKVVGGDRIFGYPGEWFIFEQAKG